jgi:hypothetical protein
MESRLVESCRSCSRMGGSMASYCLVPHGGVMRPLWHGADGHNTQGHVLSWAHGGGVGPAWWSRRRGELLGPWSCVTAEETSVCV